MPVRIVSLIVDRRENEGIQAEHLDARSLASYLPAGTSEGRWSLVWSRRPELVGL
jgi:hypothetical protein